VTKIWIADEYRTSGLLMTDCKTISRYLEDINTTIYFRSGDYKEQLANAPEILRGCRMVPWNIFCFQRQNNTGRIYKQYRNIAEIVHDQSIEKNKIEVSQ
jgi:hypothetical protein